MKLLTRTSYYYLILSCFLFFAGGTVFYFYIAGLLNEEINEQLEVEKTMVLEYIHENKTLPSASPITASRIIFTPVPGQVEEQFRDTFLISPLLDEFLPYRYLIFPVEIKGQYYAATLNRPLIEKDDLRQSIAKSLSLFLIMLGIILFLINRWLSFSLWKPFYKTIEQLKEVNANKPHHFPVVKTKEFNELHLELNRMLNRIQDQYQNLKEFTENASHELQTPLTIIRNNLEWLLQSQSLQEKDSLKIKETYEATNRLSKLYQSLLLLAKIENRQFVDLQKLRVEELVTTSLLFFEALKEYKNISLKVNLASSPQIEMDGYLAEVLISNMIGNAFKHCPKDGVVDIDLREKTLTISNTGSPLVMDEKRLFERFAKGSFSIESSGLGLAIVKQICDGYGFKVSYTYSTPVHCFKIQF